MNKTKIEWCDSTWNPVTGCNHKCKYCYARKQAKRFEGYDKGDGTITTQNPLPRSELSQPLTITRKNGKTVKAPYPFGFQPTFHKYKLDEPQKIKKPQTIFVCSMSDLFGEWVPDKWIDAVFKACKKSPQHKYFFLTKNPERYAHNAIRAENNWYGVSITRESEMHLFNYLPAFSNIFVSMEPILEDLHPEKHNILFRQVDWVILGAETGNRKNKVIPQKEWIDNIVEYCDKNKIPVFMKDSLITVVGEKNMRREFPWKTK